MYKYFIIAGILTGLASVSFGASGDKTPAGKLAYRNISTSTKINCVRGEQRHNGQYVFTCVSTNKWHRASSGDYFTN